MQAPTDLFARHQQELAEQAAAGERARVANIRRFVEMLLSLGQDCITAARSGHQAELTEALGLAAARWEQLLNLEAQIPREGAQLAALERGRVPDPADEFAPTELLAKKDAAHRNRVESRRESIKRLKEQAKAERKELESYIVKPKSRR
jgi:hypothetical protein